MCLREIDLYVGFEGEELRLGGVSLWKGSQESLFSRGNQEASARKFHHWKGNIDECKYVLLVVQTVQACR